ncbi:glycosyltransferase [bacterium]|nr:glycosyltransferase [bacterium]
MKVTNVITRDEGGGGRAARRLHDGLLEVGVESTLYVRGSKSKDHTVQVFESSTSLGDRANRWYRRKQLRPRYERIENYFGSEWPWGIDDQTIDGAEVIRQMPDSDVINLHSLYNFIDLSLFFRSDQSRRPVVWTLHDMVAFTGGCMYSDGCRRFEEKCVECPILSKVGLPDWSKDVWSRKKSAYNEIDGKRFSIVTPSQWMADQVSKSALLKRFNVSVIPYGLDTDAYSPKNKKHCREVLGIDETAKVVLFVTQYDVRNRRKGFEELSEALRLIKDVENLVLLTVGKGVVAEELGHPVVHLGEIGNERIQSIVYSAADVYLIPSIEDNFPLVVQESMACGTPVVGFASGGIPEMVVNGTHGRLVKTGESRELATALSEVLKDDEMRSEFGEACRKTAVRDFSLSRQANAYRGIYESLLHG